MLGCAPGAARGRAGEGIMCIRCRAALAAVFAALVCLCAVPRVMAEDMAGRGTQEESALKEKLEGVADSLYELIVELRPGREQGEKPAAQRLKDGLQSAAGWLIKGIRGFFDLLVDSFEGNADPRWFRMDDQTGAMLTPEPDARGALSGTY